MESPSHNDQSKKAQRIDIDAKTSTRRGLFGLLETALRRFRLASYVIALIPLYVIGILAMGISALPGVIFFNYVLDITESLPLLLYHLSVGCGLVLSYFLYGLTLIFVTFLIPRLIQAVSLFGLVLLLWSLR